MARPIILGVVGDSAAGKTTITRGLVRVLGEEQRHPHLHRRLPPLRPQAARGARTSRRCTPTATTSTSWPSTSRTCARASRSSSRSTATTTARSARPCTSSRSSSRSSRACSATTRRTLRDIYDVRVFLAPPEELRRQWKVQRDCSRRGYTTDQVLAELDRREPDSEAFIRPQQRHADIVVSFLPGDGDDQEHLDAELDAARRPRAPRPAAPCSTARAARACD